jgi:hypothetical protein
MVNCFPICACKFKLCHYAMVLVDQGFTAGPYMHFPCQLNLNLTVSSYS